MNTNIRTPKAQYMRRNGFEEFTKQFLTEDLKEAEAAEAQDVARFVIREMGSFFPSLAEMRKEVNTSGPETIASLTERIKRLKKENQENMAKLSRYYAQELYDDALDRYSQTDDIGKYFDLEDFSKGRGDEWAEHYTRLEDFFKQHDQIVASERNDLVARMQYDHLRELLQLSRRRRDLEEKEEAARIKHGAQFPQTVDEYRMMSRKVNGKDAQLLVARFLMADEPTRENLRTRCHWTRAQTEPLIREYKSNDPFRTMVERFASENESTDPRRMR